MLKLTYTENGFRMEHLTQSLEDWVRTRLILALRSATSLMVEPTTASFLLPADLPYLEELEVVINRENMEVVITKTDSDYVEVSLQCHLGNIRSRERRRYLCLRYESARRIFPLPTLD